MKKELDEIENAVVKHCSKLKRYDEHLFDLGIRLGRLLEQNDKATYRLQAFIDNEAHNNLIQTKQVEIERVNKSIEFLIRNAVAAFIEKHNYFEVNEYRSTELDEEIAQKFFVQSSNTIHNDESSFRVEFELLGEVADIFDKYGIAKVAKTHILNTSGDTEETLFTPDEVSQFFITSVYLVASNTTLTGQDIADIADELDKKIGWILLSLKSIR